jgi:hypothetical protein
MSPSRVSLSRAKQGALLEPIAYIPPVEIEAVYWTEVHTDEADETQRSESRVNPARF